MFRRFALIGDRSIATASRLPVERIVCILITAAALGVAFALVDRNVVAQAISRLSSVVLLGVTLALLCGALLASLRLSCVAADLGYRMRLIDAIAALSIGQLIGRSAVLARRGVPVAGTVAITGHERLVASAVSFAFAMLGGWYLFGTISLDLQTGGASFLKLAIAGSVAIVTSAVLAWGRPVGRFIRTHMGPRAFWRIGRSLALSVGTQVCTIIAYGVAALSISPGTEMMNVVAASCIVMLAASIPISLAGWGVRELSAIYALGAIGVDREAALVIAVLIGAVALAVVAFLAAIATLAKAAPQAQASSVQAPKFDLAAILACAVPVLATIAVFFQIYVPVSTSQLNINLADPLAIFAAALFGLERVKLRQFPTWRLPALNAHLAVMTGVIVIAFLHGWANFGVTSWALTNRLAGWFVLLAYIATGALIVCRAGDAGRKTLLRTFIAVAVAVVALDVMIFAAVSIGLHVPVEIVRYRIEGFAQNPNAFALQLLFALAATIAAMKESRWQPIVLAILTIGVWLTASRAAFVGLAFITFAALAMRSVTARRITVAAGIAAAGIAFITWLPVIFIAALEAVQWVGDTVQWAASAVAALFTAREANVAGGAHVPPVNATITWEPPGYTAKDYVTSGYELSNAQRGASLISAAQMFMANPFFGAGLGAFIESYARAHGTPLVIHSTPLWLMAELGLIGLVAFLAPFIRVLKHETFSADRADPARTFLILALLAFAAVASVHEMMYQRAFWLLLGAGLACAASACPRHACDSGQSRL